MDVSYTQFGEAGGDLVIELCATRLEIMNAVHDVVQIDGCFLFVGVDVARDVEVVVILADFLDRHTARVARLFAAVAIGVDDVPNVVRLAVLPRAQAVLLLVFGILSAGVDS